MKRPESSPKTGRKKRRFRSEASRWKALRERDPLSDGQFVYSVRTTGVFCRPTCPSRLALRRNIAFFDTPGDATEAGFRPCKRCQPIGASQAERHGEAAARACRLIESSESMPDWAALAKAVGLSRFHFHRVFKKIMGVTPQSYASAHRAQRVQEELRRKGTVTEAIYSAGFNSNSRFYARSSEQLGMTPRQFRDQGPGILIRYTIVSSSLGLALIAGTNRGICKISLGTDMAALEQELRQSFTAANIEKGDAVFEAWVQTIVRNLAQPEQMADVPLDIRGTAFQQQVWQALREILSGETTTYTEIAKRIGKPLAVRAVAGACAANPVAVMVPCHRVVRTNGSLSGYRWGVERKKELLKREQKGPTTEETPMPQKSSR